MSLTNGKIRFPLANSSYNSTQYLSQEQIEDIEQLGNEVVRRDCLKSDAEHYRQMALCIALREARP